jgi:hypothetical protein
VAAWLQRGIRKSKVVIIGRIAHVKLPYTVNRVRKCIQLADTVGVSHCALDRRLAWHWLNSVGWPDDGQAAAVAYDALKRPAYLRKFKKRWGGGGGGLGESRWPPELAPPCPRRVHNARARAWTRRATPMMRRTATARRHALFPPTPFLACACMIVGRSALFAPPLQSFLAYFPPLRRALVQEATWSRWPTYLFRFWAGKVRRCTVPA